MADTAAEHLQVKKGRRIAVGATSEQRALLLPLPERSTEASVADADAVRVRPLNNDEDPLAFLT